MNDLSFKISITVQPTFVRQKLEKVVKSKGVQSPIINQECMANSFTCNLCNADFVDYTARHLHQCIIEHKNWVIGKYILEERGSLCHSNENQLHILRRCRAKCECPVHEMVFTKERRACVEALRKRTDSIRARLLV